MSRVFTAKYRGICADCNETIYPGDEVMYDDYDELVGVRCGAVHRNPFSTPKTTRDDVCPECSMVHRGECL